MGGQADAFTDEFQAVRGRGRVRLEVLHDGRIGGEREVDPAQHHRRGEFLTREQLVLSPLATAILAGDVAPKQTLLIDYIEGEGLNFGVQEGVAAAD